MAINATDAGTSLAGVTAEASPGVAPVGVAAVDPARGLTDAEAAARRARGQGHQVKPETGRTYPQIVRQNLFTFINSTLFVIGAILIGMGLWRDAILATGLAFVNAAVGIFQEVRAKRRLDQIALLNQAKARLVRDGREREVAPDEIVLGDVLVVGPGDQILVDGRVAGGGSFDCDESLLTGESDPIRKQAGDPVYSGSFCVNGAGRYAAEKVGADSLANSIAAGARAYRLVLTPLQHSVNVIVRLLLVLAGFFLAMLLVGALIWRYPPHDTIIAAAVILGIVPTGLFLMITVTYSMAAVRLANQNALVQQTNAVESLSNVDVFCMDKTGTLTSNRLRLQMFEPIAGDEPSLREALGGVAASASASNKTNDAIADACPAPKAPLVDEVPFSSARKWSALSAEAGGFSGTFALGAPEMLGPLLAGGAGLVIPPEWTERGLRVLLFARSATVSRLHDADGEPALPPDLAAAAWLGFSDELRPQSRETLEGFREAGITLKIISGDNPETVAALARQAGLPADARLVSGIELARMSDAEFAQAANDATVFGRITPEQKERLVAALRAQGHYVAMTGDGVNDVLSLKRANLGIAMQSGSQATRAAADIVLLNDSFQALPAAFKEGQRIRRGLLGILALFLTRVFVVALIILAAAVVQSGFPFDPAQLTILTLLTVGIPTFALALFARPGAPPAQFIGALFRFVLPSAVLLGIFGFGTYAFMYFRHDVDLAALREGGIVAQDDVQVVDQVARDALTYLLVLGGLWLVVFASPPTRWWAVIEEATGDWRPTWVAIAMLPLYALFLSVPAIRDFFGVHRLPAIDYLIIGLLSIAWALLLRYAWKERLFDRLFGYGGPA